MLTDRIPVFAWGSALNRTRASVQYEHQPCIHAHMHRSLHSDNSTSSFVKWSHSFDMKLLSTHTKKSYHQHVIFSGTKDSCLDISLMGVVLHMSDNGAWAFWKPMLWWESSCNQTKIWWPQKFVLCKGLTEATFCEHVEDGESVSTDPGFWVLKHVCVMLKGVMHALCMGGLM